MSYVKSINTENLRIARENRGLSTSSASKKVSNSEKDLVSLWEAGEALPTWTQAKKLGQVYNVPELLFFSDNPLEKNKVIPDYRVGVDQADDENVKELINIVITRQKWLERASKENDASKNSIQGSGKNIGSPTDLASFIAEKLEINLEDIKVMDGYSAKKRALNYLIQKAESKGIFVGKTIAHIKIDVKNMRGLYVSNDYSPYIILNRGDAVAAQIFSFIHELAHFFRKSDAISNSLDFRGTEKGVDPEEVFCNKVAAELLLPANQFQENSYTKTDIDAIAEVYKVSQLAVFYRLRELGKISAAQAEGIEREIKAETEENLRLREQQRRAKEGGNFVNSMKDSNGGLFNRLVANFYSENRIGFVEASNLLRFSAEKV